MIVSKLLSLPVRWLVLAFAVLALAPLAVLTYVTVTRSEDAVREEARARVASTAEVSAAVVQSETEALRGLVESYARRPSLIRAIANGDRAAIAYHLRQLHEAREGISVAFLTDPRGRLLELVPATPSIVGQDFSFRDWYVGLQETRETYVSEAIVGAAAGNPRVVVASTFVPESHAVLGAGYELDQLQRLTERLERGQGVKLTVTDQRGVVLAAPDAPAGGLRSIAADPRVAAALDGRSGELERDNELSAYVPVEGTGWTVTATVPLDRAFAEVDRLRTTVLSAAGVLALVLLAGVLLLARVLLGRAAVEETLRESRAALEDANTELESQNTELEIQAAEIEERQSDLETANDELAVQRSELEHAVEELAEEKERVESLFRFGAMLAAELELEGLATAVLRELCDTAHADVGALFVRDDEQDGLALSAARGIEQSQLPELLEEGVGLAGRAAAELRPVQGEGVLELPAFGERIRVRRELHLPLVYAGRCVAVLTLGRIADQPFSDDETASLGHLADQAAVGFANALSYRATQRHATLNRAVLDATSDGIGMYHLDGRPLLQNAALERLTAELGDSSDEGTPEERLARSAARLEDPERFIAALSEFTSHSEAQLALDVELSESGRSFHLAGRPVRGADGDILGRMLVLRETTAERRADRLKSELVATVSHELRTPLTGVLGFAELMRRPDLDEVTRKRYVETVYSEARRLTNLVDDFLDVQRIELGDFRLSPERFELGELLREKVELFSAQSDAHRIVLRLSDDPLEVTAERDRIRQVVANLLSNAIKYSPEGGVVEVAAESREGVVRVSVADSGLGIPAEQQEQIFTKFFRVDSSDTRRIGGTGLGLALAREIVEAHGGSIGFSSGEGRGSTFWFELPSAVSVAA